MLTIFQAHVKSWCHESILLPSTSSEFELAPKMPFSDLPDDILCLIIPEHLKDCTCFDYRRYDESALRVTIRYCGLYMANRRLYEWAKAFMRDRTEVKTHLSYFIDNPKITTRIANNVRFVVDTAGNTPSVGHMEYLLKHYPKLERFDVIMSQTDQFVATPTLPQWRHLIIWNDYFSRQEFAIEGAYGWLYGLEPMRNQTGARVQAMVHKMWDFDWTEVARQLKISWGCKAAFTMERFMVIRTLVELRRH